MVKMVYIDVETTGLNHNRHGIHQIAGLVEIEGEVKQEFNFKVQPRKGKLVDPKALEVAGVTIEQLRTYPEMMTVYGQLTAILGRYIDKFDRRDKAFFAGYNSHFDNGFLRRWFRDCGDDYFGSYFHSGTVDIMALALYALRSRRHLMQGFKLADVATQLDIGVEGQQHDALCDVKMTRGILKALERNGCIR